MFTLIEPLESRTLLSASPQVVALAGQERLINAEYKAAAKVDGAGLGIIKGDLKVASLLKADKVELRTLLKGDAAGLKVLGKAISRVEKVISSDVKKLVFEGNKLIRKPGNAKLIGTVAALKATLSTHASDGLAEITADGMALLTAHGDNSTAIAFANPTRAVLQADVASSQSNLFASLQTLGSAVNIALTTDVNAINAMF